jgi:hypothetical protein
MILTDKEKKMKILNLHNPKNTSDRLSIAERLFIKSFNLKNLEQGEILYSHGKFAHNYKFLGYGQTQNVIYITRVNE